RSDRPDRALQAEAAARRVPALVSLDPGPTTFDQGGVDHPWPDRHRVWRDRYPGARAGVAQKRLRGRRRVAPEIALPSCARRARARRPGVLRSPAAALGSGRHRATDGHPWRRSLDRRDVSDLLPRPARRAAVERRVDSRGCGRRAWLAPTGAAEEVDETGQAVAALPQRRRLVSLRTPRCQSAR